MRTTNPSEHWKAWGDKDPYFGVLTSEAFHKGKLDANAKEQFFASGERAIDAALATIRAHVDPSFTFKRALDFGCGVGRLTLPLARRGQEAVGVDISPGMLAEARRNAERAGVENVTWVESDDGLSRVPGRFDLIYSIIVFHHIRPEVGYGLLRRLVDLLEPGGVIAVQILYHLDHKLPMRAARWLQANVPFAHEAVNVLRRRPLGTPNMEANVYSLPVVFEMLQNVGVGGVYLDFSRENACSHAMVYAQKR